MKLNQIPTIAIAVFALALALPIAALADVTGTPTLAAGTALSLDTGASSSSGGDILWSGTSMTPQSSAGAYNLGNLGLATYSTLPQSTFASLPYSKSAIPASSLAVGDVFAVKTNGGNYAKLIVTATSGTSISLQFQTFVSSAPTAPTITQILNNYGLVPAGFSNSGISPGSLFIIKGSGLADPNAQAVLWQFKDGPLPTTSNGASVKVTVGSTTTVPAFYYSMASQLALVMPSNTPLGTAQVTVTYNNQTTAPFSIQVVQNAMGFDAYYGAGSGLGVATNNATGALYNYTNSIPPGTTVVLWGSGLGADPTRDTNYNTSNINQIAGLSHIYIGGLDATIVYQGPSGYPGLNQVDVTVPNGVATGCNVSLVGVSAAGVPTNFLSFPIGNGVCSDPVSGATGTQLQNGSGQGTVNTGIVELLLDTQPASSGGGTQTIGEAAGFFESTTGTSYGSSSGSVSIGGCVVTQSVTTSTTTTTGLDAGSISVTGPSGTVTLSSEGTAGYYISQLTSGFIAAGGTYTFKGTGGANVGPFSASVTFPNPLLSWNNTASFAAVTRGSGATYTWSGGPSGSYVIMEGGSTSTTTGAFANYACIAPVAAGSFTVPSYVLSALPPGTGSSTLVNTSSYQSFTASGLNSGEVLGFVVVSVNTTYN